MLCTKGASRKLAKVEALADEVHYMNALIQTEEDIRVILCSVEVQTDKTIVLKSDAALHTDNLIPCIHCSL